MPSLEYFVVASSYSIDQYTDRVSIFEVMETFKPCMFPAFVSRMALVSVWNLEQEELDGDFQVLARIFPPGQDEPESYPMNFKGTTLRQRLLFNVGNLCLKQAGCLKIELLLNGETKAHHHIDVQAADPNALLDGVLAYKDLSPQDVEEACESEPAP